MIYEFGCGKCDLVLEHLCPMGEQPRYKKCPKCGTRCEQVVYAPAILTSKGASIVGGDKVSFDVAVGRDAEKRWDTIHRRQEVRDRIRKESGKSGLTKVAQDEYEPHDKPLQFVPCTGTEGSK